MSTPGLAAECAVEQIAGQVGESRVRWGNSHRAGPGRVVCGSALHPRRTGVSPAAWRSRRGRANGAAQQPHVRPLVTPAACDRAEHLFPRHAGIERRAGELHLRVPVNDRVGHGWMACEYPGDCARAAPAGLTTIPTRSDSVAARFTGSRPAAVEDDEVLHQQFRRPPLSFKLRRRPGPSLPGSALSMRVIRDERDHLNPAEVRPHHAIRVEADLTASPSSPAYPRAGPRSASHKSTRPFLYSSHRGEVGHLVWEE